MFNKKIQFTQTITSTQDLGLGHNTKQIAIILPPNSGSIYHGSITYSKINTGNSTYSLCKISIITWKDP